MRAALAALCLGLASPAAAIVGPFFPEAKILGQIMSYAMPTSPLFRGSNELKIVPTYASYSGSIDESRFNRTDTVTQSGRGGGGTVVYVRGFGDHWGASAVLSGVYMESDVSNTEGNTPEPVAGWTGAMSGRLVSRGQAFAASGVYDPFSDPEGFRLPIIAGLGYLRVSGRVSMPFIFATPPSDVNIPGAAARAGHGGSAGFTRTEASGAVYLGIAPQFNTGPVRWVPFHFELLPVGSVKDETVIRDLATGEQVQARRKRAGKIVAGLGLQILYRPWGLSFTYIPPLKTGRGDFGSSLYTLSIIRKWGGPAR